MKHATALTYRKEAQRLLFRLVDDSEQTLRTSYVASDLILKLEMQELIVKIDSLFGMGHDYAIYQPTAAGIAWVEEARAQRIANRLSTARRIA